MRDADRLVFGCVGISSMKSRGEVFKLLDTVLELGIRHFDTARMYGQGYSERLLGEFMGSNREGIQVTTKVGLGPVTTSALPTSLALPLNALRKSLSKKTGVAAEGPSPVREPDRLTLDYVRASITESMRMLRLPSVDVLLLHENVPSRLETAAMEYLLELKRDGVVGQLGVGADARLITSFFRSCEGVTVLQYGGSFAENSPDLIKQFPGMTHYQHSFFRNRQDVPPEAVLERALARNPQGKIVFSTRDRKRLRQNLSRLG